MLLGLCLCLWFAPVVSGAETVQSLRYGTTLFHFFQQDYYSALTELMVAQKLQQLGPHKDRAELLRGGMSLSYGMDREAEKTFGILLADESELGNATDRERAWYYLARAAWRRGDIQRSKVALDNVSSQSEGDFAEQADYLRSFIALGEGDTRQSLSFAGKLPLESPWRYYLYYNLGAQHAANGDWDAAVDAFAEFDQMSFPTEESMQLRDKALSASGFAMMAADRFEAAMAQFTRVRLDSPMADRALLGYGWAASEMGDFGLALSAWQTLTGRELESPSAREGLLAIPYAYEKLGRSTLALENYRRAANAYLVQLSAVRVAKTEYRDGDLASLLELGDAAPGSGVDAHGWIFGEDILPIKTHGQLVAHLLTRGNVQLALKELQDLYRIAWHLSDASVRLQNLAQVDADQQASWAAVTEGGRRDQLFTQHGTLQERLSFLKQGLEQAQSEGGSNSRVFADETQSRLWQKLDHASAVLKQMATEVSVVDQSTRLSVLRGLLLWQDSEQFVGRSWELHRQVDELERLTGESGLLLQRVDAAIAQRSEREFTQRIAAISNRLTPHKRRLDAAIADSESHLRDVVIAELDQREQQLSRALGQSRLAIARLYDDSSAGGLQ